MEVSTMVYVCTYCVFTLCGKKVLYSLSVQKYEVKCYVLILGAFMFMSTTGLLTPFLIGQYLELFTCLANHDKALKMLQAQTCT